MPADALATLGARASTGIVLTLLIQNILYLASEKLKYYTYHNSVKTTCTYNMHHIYAISDETEYTVQYNMTLH